MFAYAILGGTVLAYRPTGSLGVAAAGLVAVGLVAARNRPLREILVFGGLLVAGMVDWPRSVHLGPVTGSGLLTIFAAIVFSVGWWLAPRWATRNTPLPVTLLAAFVCWVLMSFAYHVPSAAGLQNVLVWISFLGVIGTVLVAIRVRPSFAHEIMLAIVLSSAIALLLYSGSVAKGGLDSHAVIDPRGFALFALIPVGCGLAWYRAGHRTGLIVSTVATLLILLSLSRLAFVTAMILWGIATLEPMHARGRVRFLFGALLAIAVVYSAVTYVKPLHDRFSHGQLVHVTTGVPGVAQFDVNLEGRLELWTTTWDSYLTSPVVGHGAGASDDLITRDYGSLAGHPHDDYLRLLNDYGAVGLALWVISYLVCLSTLFRSWIQSKRFGMKEAGMYHLSAFLSLIAVGLGMVTDNVMIYLPIMLPVGALIGLSLAFRDGPTLPAMDTNPVSDV